MSWSGIPSVSAPLLLSVRSCRINGSCDLSPSPSPIAPSSVEWTLMSLGVTTSSRLNTSSSLGSSARSFGNRAPVDVQNDAENCTSQRPLFLHWTFLKVCLHLPSLCPRPSPSPSKSNIVSMVTDRLTDRMGPEPIDLSM